MKNAVYWDVTQCGYCKNRISSKTSVLTRATKRNITVDGNLQPILIFNIEKTALCPSTKTKMVYFVAVH
jgi:hypothetical protein